MVSPSQPAGQPDRIQPQPVRVDMVHIIGAGMAIWVIALVVVLAVPSLHDGGRSWWPWVPVVSLALGVFALWYIRRGRGNASAA